MKTILITVRGGVAEVVEKSVPKGVWVEIVDFDNLEDLGGPVRPQLSRAARMFIRKVDKELAIKLRRKCAPLAPPTPTRWQAASHWRLKS